MLRIGWLIVVDWPEPPLTYAALAPHGAQPGPVFSAQGPVGIPWVIHGGRLLAIPRRSFYSNSFKHYPLVIEIYGIKIRHRSRCLRPSVWPTPAADNRLPVRWTRAVDTNHTAPKRCDRSQNGPGALSGLLCIIGGFAPPVTHTGSTPCGSGAVRLGGTDGKQGTSLYLFHRSHGTIIAFSSGAFRGQNLSTVLNDFAMTARDPTIFQVHFV